MPKRSLLDSSNTPAKAHKANHVNKRSDKISPTAKITMGKTMLNEYLIETVKFNPYGNAEGDYFYYTLPDLQEVLGIYSGCSGKLDELIHALIDLGANPNHTDKNGQSVLSLCAMDKSKVGALKMCRTLLQNKAIPDTQTLDVAIEKKHIGLAKLLVKCNVLSTIPLIKEIEYICKLESIGATKSMNNDSFNRLSKHLWDNYKSKNPDLKAKISEILWALQSTDYASRPDNDGRTLSMLKKTMLLDEYLIGTVKSNPYGNAEGAGFDYRLPDIKEFFGKHSGRSVKLDELIDALIDLGANPNHTDENGQSILSLCAMNESNVGAFKMCRTLLQNKAIPDTQTLDVAIEKKDIGLANLLVGCNALSSIPETKKLDYIHKLGSIGATKSMDNDSFNILSKYLWDNYKSENQDLKAEISEILWVLIHHTDSASRPDNDGRTPSMLNKTMLNEYLIEMVKSQPYANATGADFYYTLPDIKEFFGQHSGRSGKLDELIHALIDLGANPNHTDENDQSVLSLCAMNKSNVGAFKMCRTLLQNKAIPDTQTLDVAIQYKDKDLAGLLVGCNALSTIPETKKLDYIHKLGSIGATQFMDNDSFNILSKHLWDNCKSENSALKEEIAKISWTLTQDEHFIFKQDNDGRTPFMLNMYTDPRNLKNLLDSGLISTLNPDYSFTYRPEVKLKDKDGYTADHYYTSWKKKIDISDYLFPHKIEEDFKNENYAPQSNLNIEVNPLNDFKIVGDSLEHPTTETL